ncbi:MAG: MoaD/ThiS family protein [Nitriliruptorales bacterium]|nr:MoaD/ThiS family protein [Nitriliruptorales bacterium]
MVTVRLFAALRDAAGAASIQCEADTVQGLRIELGLRFGEPMVSRLAVSRVVVGEDAYAPGEEGPIPPGAEVAVLPPFSGG